MSWSVQTWCRREWEIRQTCPVSAFVCKAFLLIFSFSQPPTVLNPQNYSDFSVKWQPRGLAVPTAAVRAAPFPAVALINASWRGRSCLYAAIR